jgi:cytidyltransferase-like protein
MKKNHKNSVLLFGSFDGIHPGHKYLIELARGYGDHLVVVLALDSTIIELKNKIPVYSAQLRKKKLLEVFPLLTVVFGDEEQGVWTAIKNFTPGLILLGYDQISLGKALSLVQKKYKFKIKYAPSFRPEKYKSSILRKEKNQ